MLRPDSEIEEKRKEEEANRKERLFLINDSQLFKHLNGQFCIESNRMGSDTLNKRR